MFSSGTQNSVTDKIGMQKRDIWKVTPNLIMLAEECAASPLGIYKAQVWTLRMEKVR